MKILINGLPHFGKRLCDEFNSFSDKHSFEFYNTYYSTTDKIKFIAALPFCDIVLSMNGVSSNSGSLNWVLRFNKKLILYWQGTDVMLAIERVKNNTINRKYINYSKHIAVAPWLSDELQSLNIEATTLPFSLATSNKEISKCFPEFSVYSYVTNGKEELYGFNHIISLAEKFPDVTFYITGMSKSDKQLPSNIRLLGWLNESKLNELTLNTPLYLRFTKHDGYSHMVINALEMGCEVMWTMPHEKCCVVNLEEDLSIAFKGVMSKIIDRKLERNRENIEYVKTNFNKQLVLSNLLNKIVEYGSK